MGGVTFPPKTNSDFFIFFDFRLNFNYGMWKLVRFYMFLKVTRMCASLGLPMKFKTLFMSDEEKHGHHFDCHSSLRGGAGGGVQAIFWEDPF